MSKPCVRFSLPEPKPHLFVTLPSVKNNGKSDENGPNCEQSSLPTELGFKLELDLAKSRLDLLDKRQWFDLLSCLTIDKEIVWRLRKKHNIRLATNAWLKLQQMLDDLNFEEKVTQLRGRETLKSFHLCEAPGSFISSLKCWVAKVNRTRESHDVPEIQHEWWASTLKSDEPRMETRGSVLEAAEFRSRWLYGRSETGDLLDPEVIRDLWQEMRRRGGPVHLVTADGGIECENASQELASSPLISAQLVAALGLLAEGGWFVLKLFGLHTESTLRVVQVMSAHFESVQLIKPFSSKPTNSELYIIGKGFRGISPPNLQQLLISKSSDAKHTDGRLRSCVHEAVCFLDRNQISALTSVLDWLLFVDTEAASSSCSQPSSHPVLCCPGLTMSSSVQHLRDPALQKALHKWKSDFATQYEAVNLCLS